MPCNCSGYAARMADQPDVTTGQVTVVVATRNRRQQLETTLQHLLALPERPPVILVDNASDDGTVETVREALPQVRVIEAGSNLGATARTLGVRAAQTPYVAFSDDDSWWAPGSLDRAADLFDRHPRLGLIAGRILVGPDERPDPVCREMSVSPLGTEPGMPGRSILGFVACGAVVRRTAYLQVGGFNPIVFFFGEETVLAQDLAAAGWELVYVPDIVAHHHPLATPDKADRRRLQVRNALISNWLRRPAQTVWRSTAAALRQLPDPDTRRGLADAVLRLPAVLATRRVVPPDLEERLRLLDP